MVAILFYSCQQKKEAKKEVETNKSSCSKDKKFDVYQLSEMATLMERMYAQNQQLKQQIVNGDTIGKFPDYFLKIHSAKFTDETDNDAFFKENANSFITTQKLIYNDPKNAKDNFNTMVNACITCHEGKCGGPIPRIKTLFIK